MGFMFFISDNATYYLDIMCMQKVLTTFLIDFVNASVLTENKKNVVKPLVLIQHYVCYLFDRYGFV